MYIHMAILVRLSSPIKVSTIFENFLSLLVVSPSSSKRDLISSKHVTLLRLLSTSGDEELWELVSASTIDFLQYMFTYFQLIILAKKCCSNSKERYFGVNWVSTSKEKIWLCSNCLLIFTFLEFEKIVS